MDHHVIDSQLNQETMDAISVSAGQKRVLGDIGDEGQPRKKSKPSTSEDDEIQVSSGNGFPSAYPDGSLIQSPSASGREDHDSTYEYDISQSARKTGRMAGAKGYSQQEIQALFSFIREKPPVDNSDWVTMAMKYNAWAKENKKSPRTGRGLKDKLRKIALISKDDKMKAVPLNPIQQEARDCIKLINIATSMVAIDPEKEDEIRAMELGLAEQRGPNDQGFAFQPAQLNDLASLLRSILAETRQTAQRLSSIEQILENLKGSGDCSLDDIQSGDGHVENKDLCG